MEFTKSYAHRGEETAHGPSHIDVYGGDKYLICSSCRLQPLITDDLRKDFVATTYRDMILHVATHLQVGHNIPDRTILSLRAAWDANGLEYHP
jgi:hypothetical protein